MEKGDTIFAIEVKSSHSVKKDAFKHIVDFQKKSTKKVVGIVLYGGNEVTSFGDETYERVALPLGVFF